MGYWGVCWWCRWSSHHGRAAHAQAQLTAHVECLLQHSAGDELARIRGRAGLRQQREHPAVDQAVARLRVALELRATQPASTSESRRGGKCGCMVGCVWMCVGKVAARGQSDRAEHTLELLVEV